MMNQHKIILMIKPWISLFILVSMISCGGQTATEGVKLTGTVENHEKGAMLFFERIDKNEAIREDSVEIDAEGGFTAYLEVNEPAFYRLNFNDRQMVTLILTGEEEEVVINADGNDPRGFSDVSGSFDTDMKVRMDELINAYQKERAALQQRQLQARRAGDAVAFEKVSQEAMQLGIATEGELKALIRSSVPSLAAVYGLQMIDLSTNVAFMDSVLQQLKTVLPANYHVDNMLSRVTSSRRVAIGEMAPEIALSDPDGKVIKLSSLRGKYVLIDFWAAWCRPCRAENPRVVRAYERFSGNNFEILGVSLDRTREAWVQAVEQDGLPWLHVSDLKFWKSEAAQSYQVHSIPATFLIDPEGKIIAKNLRGERLEQKLREIFG